MNETIPDYSQKHYDKVMTETQFDEEDVSVIKSAYDKILSAYKIILIQDKDIAEVILKKTHLLSYISFADKFETPEKLAKWLMEFYSDMPEEYQGASTQQTTSLRHIRARTEAVRKSVEKFLM